MDGTVPHEGKKRRLPLWMLGVAAADQVSKSESKEVNDIVIIEDEGVGSPSRQTKSRARRTARLEKEVQLSCKEDSAVDGSSLLVKCESKRTKGEVGRQEVKCVGKTRETKARRTAGYEKEVPLPCKAESEVGESSLLVKCESKRKKRKVGRQEVSCSGNAGEAAFEKRKHGEVGRTIKEYACKKRSKTKRSGFESDEEIEDPSSNEDDGDLTMEDLMSIAKEFVKEDNNTGKQQPAYGEHKVESQFADISSSRNEPGGSLNAHQSNTRLPTHKEASSCHNSAEALTGEGAVVNLSMTGDPAQDMLDLFLGPLLKNPLEKDKKVELITADMRFAHELKKQEQKDVFSGEPAPPLTKKKSSLRDKVAAFLD